MRFGSKVLATEVAREQNLVLVLGSMSAEERLAVFLLNLSQRYRERGYSPSEFMLRMTRVEITSYLSLKFETVSRQLSRFQAAGLIRVQGRVVQLLALTHWSSSPPSCAACTAPRDLVSVAGVRFA